MKVGLEVKEISHGLFKKTYFQRVILTVEFNDKELEIIERKKLKNFIAVERDAPANSPGDNPALYSLTIGELLEGPKNYHVKTEHAVDMYKNSVKKQMVK